MELLNIYYDAMSGKSGVEIFRSQQSKEDKRGVVCFFHLTDTENDFQSKDENMGKIGMIPLRDIFVQERIKILIERDIQDKECCEYLKGLLS